jgi:hypothetical protein
MKHGTEVPAKYQALSYQVKQLRELGELFELFELGELGELGKIPVKLVNCKVPGLNTDNIIRGIQNE